MNENEIEAAEDTDAVVENNAVEEIPAVVAPAPAPAPASAPVPKSSTAPKAAQNAVVSGNAVDDVVLSQCVYKNKFARKSLSVHHIQRRLAEWGYADAGADRDGWYGDLTKKSVADFQKDRGLDGAGEMTADTLTALFEGDHNVNVVA